MKGALVVSGAEKARRRVAKGLPPYTEREMAARRERQRRWHEQKWRGFAPKIAALKMERGCADCGYRAHPAALQFDHLPGSTKRGKISSLSRYSWERIAEELAKCEVVCANCHAIRTVTRWQEGITPHPANGYVTNEKAASQRH